MVADIDTLIEGSHSASNLASVDLPAPDGEDKIISSWSFRVLFIGFCNHFWLLVNSLLFYKLP